MKTLRSKFVLIACCVYLVLGSLTLVAFRVGTDRIIDLFGQRFAVSSAFQQKYSILSVIDREVALSLKLADDPVLRNWCRNEENPETEKPAMEQLESYRRLFSEGSYFIANSRSNRYYVYDSNLHRLETALLSEAVPGNHWFFRTLDMDEAFALNVEYEPVVNEYELWINAAIRDSDGAKLGAGGTGIRITRFIDDIVKTEEKGVSTIIVDREGVIQAHENRKYAEYNARTTEDVKKITLYHLIEREDHRVRLRRALENLASNRSEVEVFRLALDKRTYLAAAAGMQAIGWYNVVLLDVSRIVKIAEFLPIISIAVLSLFLITCVIALLLDKVVLKPLSALTEASARVSRGEYDISLPETRRDEIGRLTTSFNRMTATVLDHTRNLEEKVRERTGELSSANRKLQDARKQVTDSIRYARMIQSSILPGQSLLDRHLGDHFILNMPRDIVGGDFYYFRDLGDRCVLAVVDCTGHGVPGALVTMSVNAVFNSISDAALGDRPGKVLRRLNRLLRNTLHRDGADTPIDSGTDIALCQCIPGENRMVFAGAGLSLYRFDNGEVLEIRGDGERLGYVKSDPGHLYSDHEISVSSRTRLYLTTDGILDQPGGSKGFGMGRERFVQMIRSVAALEMREQEEAVRSRIDEYRDNHEQRDDMLLLGFTLSSGENDA